MNLIPWRFRIALKNALTKRSWGLSQAGQDLWIFGEAFNESKGRFFLDIGAHDGIHISNTYVLEKRYHWRGICIEANPRTFLELTQNRKSICINICLDSAEGEVDFAVRGVRGGIIGPTLDNSDKNNDSSIIRLRTKRLDDVLEENSAPRIIDYLSIDVEGAEDRILESFDFERRRFNCITIERPSQSLREMFAAHGYSLVKEIPGLDCFYVHANFLDEYISNLYSFYAKRQLSLRWM